MPDRQKKKTSSKGCADPGFRKPANFLGETPFFFKNGLPVQGKRGGGPRGAAAEAGCEPEGSKTPKTGEKCPVLRRRPVISHIKLQFLFTRRSGRTLRTRFPPPGSAIFRSEARPVDAKRCRSGRALAERKAAHWPWQRDKKYFTSSYPHP